MKKLRRRRGSFGSRPDWRTYQSGLRQARQRRNKSRTVLRSVVGLVLVGGLLYLLGGTVTTGLELYQTIRERRAHILATTAPLPEVEAPAVEAPAKVPKPAGPSPAAEPLPDDPPAAMADSAAAGLEAAPPPAAAPAPSADLLTAAVPEGGGCPLSEGAPAPSADPTLAAEFTAPVIDKDEIQVLFEPRCFVNLSRRAFDYDFDGRRYHIETSIDAKLQQYMLRSIQPKYAQAIGIVVMEPDTGRILSMVSHHREDPGSNVCTESLFPAASIFKIVTAAAAVEEFGLMPDSTVTYSGAKHTLYKSQLKRKNKRHLNRISLRDSFAQSVNPVFGKLGLQYLQKKGLISHAEAFGFNQEIEFELPTAASAFSISDEPYNWAEIASGFNRSTMLSPLHGAIMASAVVANQGRMVEPSIVDQIIDSSGRVIYRSRSKTLNRALSPQSSTAMRALMKETIRTGTCRKTFRGVSRSAVLSRLNIGGKSGSINSRTHEGRRFDWFVGYAEEKEGERKIVLSIVVAHQNFIGIKSNMYARMAIEKFFDDVGPKI